MFSEEEMKSKLGCYPGFEFQYRQIHNLFKMLQQNYDLFRPMILFESLAINIHQKSLLAQLCNWLLIQTGELSTFKGKWERVLGGNFTDAQWERLDEFNQTVSVNVNIRESRFKMLHKWYLTPERLSKMYLDITNQC